MTGEEEGTREFSLPRAGRERARRFRKCLGRAARDPGDPEAVHDLRVSIRRLQAFLSVAGSVTPPGRRGKEAAAFLRSLMAPLGRLRDAQVRLGRIVELVPRGDGGSYLFAVHTRSEVEREEALVRRLLPRADPSRATRGLPWKRLGAMAEEEVAYRARRALAERFRAVEELREGALGCDRDLHRLRLRFKRFRYAAELLAPLYPGWDEALPARLHAFQTLLGNVQDLVVLLAEASSFRRGVLRLSLPTEVERGAEGARRKEAARARAILRDGDAFRSALFGSPSLPFGTDPSPPRRSAGR